MNILLVVAYLFHGAASLPDKSATPGKTLTTDIKVICKPGYAKSVRSVSENEKRAVYNLYIVTKEKKVCCEVDHLIPLELGGSNELSNLWPQPYVPIPAAYEKDRVETWLHNDVCSGKLSLKDAQRDIVKDWYAVYLKLYPKHHHHVK